MVEGSATLKGSNFTINNANIDVSGSGNVDVRVTDTLDVKISGSGRITYRGEPKTIRHTISGSGKIRKL